jgi:hypothetical protein
MVEFDGFPVRDEVELLDEVELMGGDRKSEILAWQQRVERDRTYDFVPSPSFTPRPTVAAKELTAKAPNPTINFFSCSFPTSFRNFAK